MKKLCIGALLLLTLAACATPTAAPATIATVDPFLALDSAQRTAEAAQDQAQTYSRQLTATAEAPIIQITQQAAAWQLQQDQAQATATWGAVTQSAVSTATAQAWTPTPTPTYTPDATATMVAIRTAAEIARIQQETERAELTNTFWAIILPVFLLALLVVTVIGAAYWAITYSRSKDIQVIERGNGDSPILVSLSKRRAIDMDAAPNFAAGFEESLLRAMLENYLKQKFGMEPSLPQITAARQDVVKERDQLTDLKTRTKVTNAALDRFMKEHALSVADHAPTPTAITAPVVSDDDINMPLPPWDFITRWNPNEPLPLGFGRMGLITAKAASPHILIAGKTGSRKTRGMLRPLTAAALAKGHVVFNIGYSQAGFGVFGKHPNYYNANITDPRDILNSLSHVYDEHKRRKAMIGDLDREWEHWEGGRPPEPFAMLLVDELEMLSEDLYSGYSNGSQLCSELWSLTARIAKEGRKTGIVFIGALQDGTSKSIDLRFRRNCTLVTFQLGDPSHSNAFIGAPGADKLTEGHFMARTDGLVIGGAFMPTDLEITAYLNSAPVQVEDKPKWIDAVSVPRIEPTPTAINIIEPTATESLPESKPVDEIAEMAERIRSRWSPKMSGRHVATNLLGLSQYGGAHKTKTDRVIAYLTSTTPNATITENQPEMGILTPEMA